MWINFFIFYNIIRQLLLVSQFIDKSADEILKEFSFLIF